VNVLGNLHQQWSAKVVLEVPFGRSKLGGGCLVATVSVF
jgi:hypothetical protein